MLSVITTSTDGTFGFAEINVGNATVPFGIVSRSSKNAAPIDSARVSGVP
jgi:hypothetical protein